ncbi:hypothetical protein GCM10011378_40150 [Hymenobacter glacieicola]|uniref:DUF805 domain-containing protein n=2 Tax=Hymenobacter glacieicola TaxID=1562124 RepID=A0ABQ1X589_9BACT|nr:hypothetical protein GCM10011378_40150 [Hymenobacter glacieicola]
MFVLSLLQVVFPPEEGTGNSLIMLAVFIPCAWFLLAQGTKRCHDRNNSGWYQMIPFYAFWMLFAAGDSGLNAYGEDPKAAGVSVDTY